MSQNVALTGGETTALALCSTRKTYMSTISRVEVGHATVDGTPTFPTAQITVKSPSAGWGSGALGQTAIVTRSGVQIAILRTRYLPDSTNFYPMQIGNGDPGLLNIDLRSTGIQDGDLVTVYNNFDVWSINPRIFYNNIGVDAVIYEDYNYVVSTNNSAPGVIVNLDVSDVSGRNTLPGWVDSGQTYRTITITATCLSWPTSGALTYTWTTPGGCTLTAGGGNTASATYRVPASATSYIFKLNVAEANGGLTNKYLPIWSHSTTYPPITVNAVSSDVRDRTGRKATLSMIDNNLSNLTDGGMVVLWDDCTWNGSATSVPTATTQFVGWLLRNTQRTTPGLREADVEIVGPAGLMAALNCNSQQFNSVTGAPTTWQEVKSSLCFLDFFMWWMVNFRTTLLYTFNYYPVSVTGTTKKITTLNVPPGTLLSQMQALAGRWGFANFGVDSAGQIIVAQHPSVTTYSTRSTNTVTRDTITPALRSTPFERPREYRPHLRRLIGGGFMSDGTVNTPLLASADSAPGQGSSDEQATDLIVDSQQDLSTLIGQEARRRNNPWPSAPYTIPHNRDVIEPAQMQFVAMTLPAASSADGTAWNKNTVPLSVSKKYLGGGATEISGQTETETVGVDAETVPVPPADTTLFGGWSSITPVSTPFTPTWGVADTRTPLDPSAGTGTGLLICTKGCRVARGDKWKDISPATSQRSAVGVAIRLLADPYQYKRLILFGSQGGAICDDATVSSPKWRTINLAVSTSTGWTQTFDFSGNNGGWSGGFAPALATYGSGKWNSTHFNPGGPTGEADSLYILSPSFPSSLITTVRVVGFATYAQGTPPGGRNVAGISPAGNLPTGTSAFDTTVTLNTNLTQISVDVSSNNTGDATTTSGKNYITLIAISGTGANPFGGSGVTSETFIADMLGSPNKKGYFAWLSKKTVGGTDYVYFNYTFNYFSTKKSVQVATYSSGKLYGIAISGYNSGAAGTLMLTAGTDTYKSTNWGATWAAQSITINASGGPINIPYKKAGGGANGGTSPKFCVITGIATDLKNKSLAAGTGTIASGSSHIPYGAQALTSYTLDGNYISVITADGNVYISSDGGATWSAATAAGASGYGINGWPTNKNFLLAFGSAVLKYSTNRGTAWTDLYTAYRTFADTAYGSGLEAEIVTAMGDLSKQYTRSVAT